MLISSKYSEITGREYEIWSELVKYRLYINEDIIRQILGSAYNYAVFESVWCLNAGSSEGNSFEDHMKALLNDGFIVLEDTRKRTRYVLTLNKLVSGIEKHIKKFDDIKKLLCKKCIMRDKNMKFYKLDGIENLPKVCDEILQLAVFGTVKYE